MSEVLQSKQAAAGALPGALGLRPAAFAALVMEGEAEEALGRVAGDDRLPKALRRRMTQFDLMAARCIAGLAADGAAEEIVFASRYGNMAVTFDLLTQVVTDELLSPAKFSVSVHNAAAGAASLIAKNRGGHTAISALGRSLAAGLTEAWIRIADGAPSVIFVYSDLPLMQPYSPFDEPGPGVTLAIRFTAGSSADAHVVENGREGAAALARALAEGAEGVIWAP
jgi:hypothetical protein